MTVTLVYRVRVSTGEILFGTDGTMRLSPHQNNNAQIEKKNEFFGAIHQQLTQGDLKNSLPKVRELSVYVQSE